jgi:uncharacterized membrane protein
MGVSGGTIVGGLAIILFCFLCGYLVRLSFFRFMSDWTDRKLRKHVPGYEVYREMAISKLEQKEEALPYESAAWADMFGMLQPCFLMETMPDGKYVVFFPTAGNTKEGIVLVLDKDKVKVCPDVDMRAFRNAISNLGLGFAKIPFQQAHAGKSALKTKDPA